MKRELNFGLIVFLLALAPRVAWVALRWGQVGPQLDFPDERVHWQLATHLVTEGTLVTDDGRYAVRMPLYPLFLAPFALGGDIGILLARLAQATAGAAGAWLAWRFAARVLGRRAGLIAGVLVALDPFGVFFCHLLLSETVVTPVLLAATWWSWRLCSAADTGQWGLALAAAAAGAASVFLRSAAWPWLLALWGAILLLERFRRRAIGRVGLAVAVFIAAMLPWGLRNHARLGDYAWFSSNGGVTLYDAQGPQADGSSNQNFLAQMPELNGLGEAAADRRLLARAVQQMRSDPGRVVWLAGVKFKRFWNPLPNLETTQSGLAVWGNAALTALGLLAAAVGVGRLLARRPGRSAEPRQATVNFLVLVLLPIVVFTLLHCVFIGSVRYRAPLMPFVYLLAAAAFMAKSAAENRAVTAAVDAAAATY